MRTLKTASIAFVISLVYACSHPIEISGKGDVYSASGNRNCHLEDFDSGKDNCAKNLVIGDYQETYYAVARPGWKFEKWMNYCTQDATDECSFKLKARVVQQYWGAVAPPLVAVFTRDTSTDPEPQPKPLSSPEPIPGGVAIYSYQLDSDGKLVKPLPLAGASLKRKVVYFSYTGDYTQISFWCCKVAGGSESHMPRFNDVSAPFVFKVDLAQMADDFGRKRELYADFFHHNGSYQNDNIAYWTLEPLPGPTLYKVIARGQIYRSDNTEFIPVGTSYSLEWTYYNYARAVGYDDGVCTDNKFCEYMNNGDSQGALRNLTLTIENAEYTTATLWTHGLDPIRIEKGNSSTGDSVRLGAGELSTDTFFTFTGSLSSLVNMSFILQAKSGGVLLSPNLVYPFKQSGWDDIGISLDKAVERGAQSGFSMTYSASDDPWGPRAQFHGLSGTFDTLSIQPADQ